VVRTDAADRSRPPARPVLRHLPPSVAAGEGTVFNSTLFNALLTRRPLIIGPVRQPAVRRAAQMPTGATLRGTCRHREQAQASRQSVGRPGRGVPDRLTKRFLCQVRPSTTSTWWYAGASTAFWGQRSGKPQIRMLLVLIRRRRIASFFGRDMPPVRRRMPWSARSVAGVSLHCRVSQTWPGRRRDRPPPATPRPCEALDRVSGLSIALEEVRNYSLGNKQRLGIARAAAARGCWCSTSRPMGWIRRAPASGSCQLGWP